LPDLGAESTFDKFDEFVNAKIDEFMIKIDAFHQGEVSGNGRNVVSESI
jgi:hypothetical protein